MLTRSRTRSLSSSRPTENWSDSKLNRWVRPPFSWTTTLSTDIAYRDRLSRLNQNLEPVFFIERILELVAVGRAGGSWLRALPAWRVAGRHGGGSTPRPIPARACDEHEREQAEDQRGVQHPRWRGIAHDLVAEARDEVGLDLLAGLAGARLSEDVVLELARLIGRTARDRAPRTVRRHQLVAERLQDLIGVLRRCGREHAGPRSGLSFFRGASPCRFYPGARAPRHRPRRGRPRPSGRSGRARATRRPGF